MLSVVSIDILYNFILKYGRSNPLFINTIICNFMGDENINIDDSNNIKQSNTNVQDSKSNNTSEQFNTNKQSGKTNVNEQRNESIQLNKATRDKTIITTNPHAIGSTLRKLV
jgi:hypothetical protein